MYCIIDIETTGGNNKSGRITEIAAFLHDGHKEVDRFHTLVNPEIPIPSFITGLTGITDKMVADAPLFTDIARDLLRFTANAVFVAHNVNFDYGFIREEFKRIGVDFKRKRLCTVQLSKHTFPGLPSYSLGKLTRQLGIELLDAHRAEADAKATLQLFERIIGEKAHAGLFETNFGIEDISHIDSPLIDADFFRSIPDDSGVYRIFDKDDQLIYVKRSSQILSSLTEKLRSNGTRHQSELIREAYRIDWEITGSSLLAQLIEAEEVLTHKPRFNYGRFSMRASYGIFRDKDGDEDVLALHKSRTRRNQNPLIVFSSFFEGFDYLKKISSEYGFKMLDIPAGKNPTKAIALNGHSNEDARELIFDRASSVIVDESPEIDRKTLVLIKSGIVVGSGLFEEDHPMNSLPESELSRKFKPLPELEMISRHFIIKKKVERVIRL